MPMIETPLGTFAVPDVGEAMLERAIQNGGQYSFKVEADGLAATTLKGIVRRSRKSPHDYVLEVGSVE